MNVTELFRRLSFGELSNISLGAEGIGAIAAERQAMVVSYINESLLRLHSRFVLIEGEVILELADNITQYHLNKRFAKSNPNPRPGDTLYIRDGDDTFKGDVLKVLSVVDDRGCGHTLNDSEDPRSLFTPRPLVLQVPEPSTGTLLSVQYQARHPALSADDLDACILLPDQLHGALTAHVAYQVFSFMNGVENAAKAKEHMDRYELICREIEQMDLVNSSSGNTNMKFYNRGFC